MSQYLVRVELHNANYDDYESLHAAMERAGFSRTIRGDDGKSYQLPTAEYHTAGNYSATGVRDAAAKAAASVGKRYAVVAAEASSIAWVGLSEVVQHAYR
jgi:hypothetical protein